MVGKIIAIVSIVLIVGGALAYIIKAKKSGQKCIGCPHAKTCNASKCCYGSKEEEKKEEDKT